MKMLKNILISKSLRGSWLLSEANHLHEFIKGTYASTRQVCYFMSERMCLRVLVCGVVCGMCVVCVICVVYV